ncbi:MAG: DUF1858 domain-containing protein [Pseudomonadota bacterium]
MVVYLSLDDPELAIRDLLTHWPETVPVFLHHEMSCVGCLISPFHTVRDACIEYKLDESTFRKELQEAVTLCRHC